jgi:hypothetical protein
VVLHRNQQQPFPTMTLHVGDRVAIDNHRYKGHYGVIIGSTDFSWNLKLLPQWRKRNSKPTLNTHATLRFGTCRALDAAEIIRMNPPPLPTRPAPESSPPAVNTDDVELQLLAQLVALRLTDDRRRSLFLDELGRYDEDPSSVPSMHG